ncbi:MAG: thiamine diphosphokinase [Actinobacteria bacterium]|nr:thiamine diphosphokinase [Actinomycetota bacterium]
MQGDTVDKRVLVITGGTVMRVAPRLDAFDLVVAADSGVDSAFALGLHPDVVIGDLDSVSASVLARARESNVTVIQSPTDKDLTDTELALAHLLTVGARHATVLSPGGGRLDHSHGLLAALANPALSAIAVEAIIDTAHVTVLHGADTRSIPLRGSHLTALHAMNGVARGVTTSGFRWNLTDEDLAPWVSRGVSNEMVAPVAEVSVDHGALIVVQPLAHNQSPTPNTKET